MAEDQVQEVARALGMKPAEIVAVADGDEGVVVDLFDGTTVVIVEGKPFIKGGNPETSKLPVLPEPVEDDEAPADEGDDDVPAPSKRATKKAAAKAPADEGDDD